jgi:hypothetical protein
MSTPVEPTTEPTTPPTTEPASTEPQKTPEELISELTAERDKWKNLSRQNEKKWEEASTERDKLKEAQMSDAEKAIEEARQEARKAALSEVGADLVKAELALQAATAGAKVPDAQFLNISQFLGEDGRPNKEAVQAFVDSLPKAGSGFPELQGAGKQTGGAPEITTMDPNELADLITDGSFI